MFSATELLVAFICIPIFLGFGAITHAAVYYVATDGNDANPGTETLPLRTIQKAANVAMAGDVIIVKSGTYEERVILPAGKSGSPDAKIVFRAEPRRSVYIKGFQGDRNNYIRIEGFNITYDAGGWLGGGIWLDGNNWEIVDNYFYDVAGAAIQPTWQSGRSINNVYLAKNKMYKCNKGFIVGGSNWLVEDNAVERLVYYSEDADYSRFFGENHIIRNNYFHGTRAEEIGSSHVDGFQTFNNNGAIAKNIIIESNIVDGLYHEGIMAEGGDGSHDNIIVRNNIFMNSGSWGLCIYGVTNLKVYNNVFANITSTAIGIRKSKSSGSASSAEIKNNIFYNFGAAYWAEEGSTLDARSNLLYREDGTIDPSAFPNDLVNIDPKFVNPQAGDFRLQADSPAIDSGISLLGFSNDILGVTRPQGRGWDIGAYEYQVAIPGAPKNLRVLVR
jgi:hypothetical protein